jgi:hypothetical protein
MRKRDVFDIILKAAEVSGYTEFVIIGSQAVHGTLPDPDIDVVIGSNDVDTYPSHGYGETSLVYEELMLRLGQDSDYHIATNVYIEAVPANLARFPADWRGRAITEIVGAAEINGESCDVNAIFPEIHDLTVSKLSIRRQKDLEFLQGVVDLNLVDHETLCQRFRCAPNIPNERLIAGLADISEAFDRRNRS